MSQLHRITVDSNVCAGRPCIRGLRIRVKDISSTCWPAGPVTRRSSQIPRILWVRFGNTTTSELLGRFDAHWPAALEALSRGDGVIELS